MATNPFSEFLSGVKKLWFVATGAAADNATASGNPVLVGGRYSATPATRHDGDVATIETDSQGRVLTVVSGSIVAEEDIITTNTTIASGGTYISPVKAYKGKRVGVIARFTTVVKHTINANFKDVAGATTVNIAVVANNASTGKDMTGTVIDKMSKQYTVSIANNEGADIVIQRLVVTEFI